MAVMIILSLCAVIIAVIGAWYFIAQDNFWMFIVCIILAFVGMITGTGYFSNETERDIKNRCNEIIAEKNAEIETLKEELKNKPTYTWEEYYAGAEIIDQKELDNGTYEIVFTNVTSTGLAYGHTYKWISDYEYPDDIPYLLTMDCKGTDNVEDDEIVVVWMNMN